MQKPKGSHSKGLFFPDRLTKFVGDILSHPLTLVEAPMGYGKTTFVKESLKHVSEEVLWLKVNSNDVRDFWRGFCRKLSLMDEEGALRLEALGFPKDKSELHEALRLIEAMPVQKLKVLVIDDYHIVANTETNQFFERLIMDEISGINLVLIGRHSGLQSIEELKLKGYLLHIKKEAFEFTAEDIKAYYQLCGIRLSSAKARDLFSLTEGWISALYLIVLDYLENETFGISRDIGKLIENAIYTHFTVELKQLMLSLCLFDGFTLKQAIFMSRNQQAESLLREVISKNAFVTYDSESKQYQIHSIFANFLQEELERKSMQIDMYRRAAQWFIESGEYNLAFQYCYLCQDFDSIFMAIDKQLNYTYKKELIVKCCMECPDVVKANYPFAMLVLAFELYTYNEMELFGAICETFLGQLQENTVLRISERDRLLGEYELLMSFTQFNDIRMMAPHFIKAAALLKEPSRLLPQNGIWTFGSPSILYMFYRESGKLDEALEALFEVLPLYSRATNGNANAGEYCMKAEQYMYRGDFENALIISHQAIYRAASKNQVANTLCARFIMARIALMKGLFPEAIAQYQKIRKEIDAAKEYVLLHTLEICEGYVYALLNKASKIPEWLLEGDYSSDKSLFPNYAMLNIVRGRAILIRGDYHRLIGSMDEFMTIASIFPNLLGQIYTCIYVAAAHRRLLRQNDALLVMRQALDMAMPDRFYLPFVENCDYIKPLLEEIRYAGSYIHEINEILTQYTSYEVAIAFIDKTHFLDKKPKLTDREMEICHLVAQGLTNKEIAGMLFITVNTVKMALKVIYIKLSINNRNMIKQCLDSI